LCHSPNVIHIINSQRMRWAGHVAHTGEKGRPEGKTALVKPRCTWQDHSKVDLQGTGY